MRTETYSVRVHCTNCGYKGKVSFRKGCQVNIQECPNCDCVTLVSVDARKGDI